MVAGSYTQETESTIAPARLWKAGILDAHVLLPKISPEIIASIDIIEGDGGVGTIKQCNFTPGMIHPLSLSIHRLLPFIYLCTGDRRSVD